MGADPGCAHRLWPAGWRREGGLLPAAFFPGARVTAEIVIYSHHNLVVGLVRVGNTLVFSSQV